MYTRSKPRDLRKVRFPLQLRIFFSNHPLTAVFRVPTDGKSISSYLLIFSLTTRNLLHLLHVPTVASATTWRWARDISLITRLNSAHLLTCRVPMEGRFAAKDTEITLDLYSLAIGNKEASLAPGDRGAPLVRYCTRVR